MSDPAVAAHSFREWSTLDLPLAQFVVEYRQSHADHTPLEMHEDFSAFQYVVECSCGEQLRITHMELIANVQVR